MNKNRILRSISFIPLLLFVSCASGVVVELQNNSGEDLVVVNIYPNGQEETYRIKKNRVLHMGVPSRLRVEHIHGKWSYEHSSIPMEFEKRKNSMISVISLQIEKDGTIYVLPPGAKGPAGDFPAQPPGYPLRPNQT
jgi:hypothetical protein